MVNRVHGVVFSLHRSLLLVALVAALAIPIAGVSAGPVPQGLGSVQGDPVGIQSAVGNATGSLPQQTPHLIQLRIVEQLEQQVMEVPRPDPPRLDGWAGPERGGLELVWHRDQPFSDHTSGMLQIQGGIAPVRNYTLYVSEDPAQGFEPLANLSARDTGFTHDGLEDGKTLHYRVSAGNEFGEGPPSNTVSLTTWNLPGPVAFQGAQQDSRSGEVTLFWLPPVDDGGMDLTHYTIYASSGREGPFDELITVGSGNLSFTDSDLKPDEVRYYRISATNGLGEGPSSKTVRAVGLAVGDLTKAPRSGVPGPDCVLATCERPMGTSSDPESAQESAGSGGHPGITASSSVASSDPVVDPVVAAGVAVGAATALFPLVQLYRRIAAKSALEQTRRRQVYEQILEHPGATTADLARTLRLHYSTVRHHLDLLRVVEEVESRRIHGRMRWFPNHRTYGAVAKAAAAALAVESQRRIIQALMEKPGICAGDISRCLGLAPPTVSHHLKRLGSLGLVERRREAQWVRYRLAPEVPKALEKLKNPV